MKLKNPQKTILLVCLSILAAIWLLPLWTMIMVSFKTQIEMIKSPYIMPPFQGTLANYVKASSRIGRGLLNSIIVSLPATVLCILIGSLGGYFLSMFKFKYSKQFFFVTAVATFLPYEVVLIPITQFIKGLHLINTYPGLILVYTILNAPLATLVTATFFQVFPKEIQEAASLDGCTSTQFFWKILMPLSKATIVSVALLIFAMIWNEFLLALTLTQGPSVRPVLPAVVNLSGSYSALWNLQMAGAVLSALPPIILFVFLGRYFAAGLVASALKM